MILHTEVADYWANIESRGESWEQRGPMCGDLEAERERESGSVDAECDEEETRCGRKVVAGGESGRETDREAERQSWTTTVFLIPISHFPFPFLASLRFQKWIVVSSRMGYALEEVSGSEPLFHII